MGISPCGSSGKVRSKSHLRPVPGLKSHATLSARRETEGFTATSPPRLEDFPDWRWSPGCILAAESRAGAGRRPSPDLAEVPSLGRRCPTSCLPCSWLGARRCPSPSPSQLRDDPPAAWGDRLCLDGKLGRKSQVILVWPQSHATLSARHETGRFGEAFPTPRRADLA